MKNNRAQLIFIFLVVFIDLLGVGIVLPLLPFYVKLIEADSPAWMAENHALIVGGLTASYSLFQFLFAPILGGLSDRFGRRPVLLVGALGGLVWAFVFVALVNTRVPGLILLASFVGMLFTSAMFSPLASFLPELFPTRVRCTGASLCFQLAGVFGGAPAPLIAVPLAAAFASGMPVAVYLAVTLAIMAVSVLAARETAHMDLRGVDAAAARI